MASIKSKRRNKPIITQPTANPHEQVALAQRTIDAALADATVQAFLADYGCTSIGLQQGLQLCRAAQQNLRMAEESVAALNRWMEKFVVQARTALQQRPDLMGQLDL